MGPADRGICRMAYTLIEQLMVLLVVAILMGAAMPIYNSAMTNSWAGQCRQNMVAIANAQQEYRIRDAGHGHAPSYAADMTTLKAGSDLKVLCPCGGTYVFDSFSPLTIHCTYAYGQSGQHGTYVAPASPP